MPAHDQRHLPPGKSLDGGNRPFRVAGEGVVDVADPVDVADRLEPANEAPSPRKLTFEPIPDLAARR